MVISLMLRQLRKTLLQRGIGLPPVSDSEVITMTLAGASGEPPGKTYPKTMPIGAVLIL